jgi:Xaa-Pro aminopeptidase
MPHARAGDRQVQNGDAIVLDLGCIFEGYRSDLTRTGCIGEPSPKYLKIWNIVRDAQQAAFDGIRPGMTAGDADALARDVIVAAGYGDQFGHSLGHGIGLETHEAPFVRAGGDEILREGMIFSVEPGIYLPGEFGVRIEDLVLLEAGGARVLSQAPKAPVFRGNE